MYSLIINSMIMIHISMDCPLDEIRKTLQPQLKAEVQKRLSWDRQFFLSADLKPCLL